MRESISHLENIFKKNRSHSPFESDLAFPSNSSLQIHGLDANQMNNFRKMLCLHKQCFIGSHTTCVGPLQMHDQNQQLHQSRNSPHPLTWGTQNGEIIQVFTLVPSPIHSQSAGHAQLAGASSLQFVYAPCPSSKYGIANGKGNWSRNVMTRS